MSARKFLTIDVGGTQVKYAIVSEQAEILQSGKENTPKDSLDAFWTVLDQIVARFHEDIAGVAISVPGKVDTKTGTVYFGGALTYLHGACFTEHIQQQYDLPVAVQNDAKAAALAEQWIGALQGIDNGAMITLGTGVGGGVILDGKLRLGPHFQAGELSWMVMDASKSGHEQVVGYIGSAVTMITRVNEVLGNADLSDGVAAFEAINAGHEAALAIFQSYCRHIAYLILNMQAVYDLTDYVIGGGISIQPIVVAEIRRQYDTFLDNTPILKLNLPDINIVQAKLTNDANLFGALYQLLGQLG